MRRLWILVGLACLLWGLPVEALAAQPAVEGRSAVLMELRTGTVLYEHNSHEQLAPASVTKVMTMLLIMEAVDSGSLSLQDSVTASAAAAAKGGSQVYLKEGETMTVEEMLKSIAVSSANDCACAMAEHLAGSEGAFVERMNQKAAELGMADTHFVNCTGLDDAPEAESHRTSAYDIALMSRELMVKHPEIRRFTTVWMDTVRNGAFGLTNTNKLIRFYKGATGLKTGFTSGAGYCLAATAERDGMELVAVVMGADSSGQRFDTCRQLLDYGFAGYALVSPEPESGPAEVNVVLGKEETVSAKLAEATPILVEKEQRAGIRLEPHLEPSVTAPVSRGQRLGTLTVYSGDRVLAELPLVAAREVGRLTWGDVFGQVLRKTAMAG